MAESKKGIRPILAFLTVFGVFFFTAGLALCQDRAITKKLYWFIPDGMRAEPDLFNIYKWAQEGKLPNIKKMMDNGSFGYSIPVFPSHTPVNFATLLTGSLPKIHGVADGPMHIEGFPLDKPSLGGFSSTAKKVAPIWVTLEDSGKKVILLSIPGSTPPELDIGITIRGRWGGWGADFPAVNFQPLNNEKTKKAGRARKLFFFGPELTRYIEVTPARDWQKAALSFSPALEAKLDAFGENIYAYIFDTTDDKTLSYNRMLLSFGKKEKIGILSAGEWSKWMPVNLSWQGTSVASHLTINLIKLDGDGFFRVRVLYDNLNELIVKPSFVAGELTQAIGPMVDCVDNFPPQLVYYPEDKKTFLDEAGMSLDWHKNAVGFIFNKYKPDIFIHDIYTPNQMLTSRWWMGYIDPKSRRYEKGGVAEKDAWREVMWMYKKLDDIIGQALKKADKDTLIVLSSDHGAIPLNKYVRINNFLAKEGYLKFRINSETQEPVIDWNNSQAIYLKMDNIYINPEGLSGNYRRAKGRAYEELRKKISGLLRNLTDEGGLKPIVKVVNYEDASEFLGLPPERVGDLVLANNAGYGFDEEMTQDLAVFIEPRESGYKQAVLPKDEKGMWTPFIIMGPGVKKGYAVKGPIRHIDQYPTIMRLLGEKVPDFVEGKAINEIYEK